MIQKLVKFLPSGLWIFSILINALPNANGQYSLREMLAQQFPDYRPSETTTEAPFSDNVYQAVYEQIPISNDPRYDAQSSAAVTKAVLKMAHDMTELLIHNNANSDFQIISPVSIAAALSLVLLGARGNTHQELLHTFGYDADQALSSMPYKIHEEFGLLIEDMLNDLPNENRTRWATPWKHNGNKGFLANRFHFPDEELERRVIGVNTPAQREGRVNFPEASPASNSPPPSSPLQQLTPGEINEHKIYVANGIFVQNGYSILPDYRTVVTDIYKSQLISLDFDHQPAESAQFINKWVQRSTRNKIKSIVDENIAPETKVIIANALYFKALWDGAFYEGATNQKPFYPDGLENPPINVEMMANGGKFPHYFSTEYDCDILGLPYKRKLTTMYIILPRNSNRQKLQELQKSLTPDKIEELIQRMEVKSAIILFPKLHLSFSTDLVGILAQLGANTIFNPHESDLGLISDGAQKSARKRRSTSYKVESSHKDGEPLRFKDFVLNKRITKPNPAFKKSARSRREVTESYTQQALRHLDSLRYSQNTYNPGLYVGKILHKVELTINEKGTEAGAATSVTLNRTGVKVIFRCEAPFMFLIRHDDTKLPIFYGAVFKPQS